MNIHDLIGKIKQLQCIKFLVVLLSEMTGQTADSYEFFIYKEKEIRFSHITSTLSPNGYDLES